MPCYRPLQAFYGSENRSGKRKIVFDEQLREAGSEIVLPCGKCIGCRLERSRQWAIRCLHEASLHFENCFITLTYDDKHLPKDGSLNVKHFQDFMKRFRRRFPENGIRFFHCGEYGSRTQRPHYHACIFGFDFDDKKFLKKSSDGNSNLYTSALLESLWPFGLCSIGDVTFESAAYVARYIVDKLNVSSKSSDEDVKRFRKKYEFYDSTGEILIKKLEYVTMSRRPGIGAAWFDKYKDRTYSLDAVTIRGRLMKPPKFYDTRFELFDSDKFEDIKAARIDKAAKYSDDQTLERLAVREVVHLSKMNLFNRNVE